MNEKTARSLSLSIAVVAILVVLSGLVISIIALAVSGERMYFSHQIFTPLLTLTYCGIGVLVATRHPRNPIGWIFCAIGLLSAINMLAAGYSFYNELITPMLPGSMIVGWLNRWVWMPGLLLSLTFTLLLFPDGKLPSSRWRALAWIAGFAIVSATFILAFYPSPIAQPGLEEVNPYGIVGGEDWMNGLMWLTVALLLISVFGSVFSVVQRYRKAVGEVRDQLRWLVGAGVVVILVNLLGGLPYWIWGSTPVTLELWITANSFSVASIVVATGVAIRRYRLWDIHILINRALVYGFLTVLIVALYVVMVSALGRFLQSDVDLTVSLVATGIIAVSFLPLRDRLQLGVNRLMYGERDDPYVVLDRLSERLEVVAASQSVLPTIVETVAEALKLPYAAVAIKNGEQMSVAAEYRRPSMVTTETTSDLELLPLVYQKEVIGQLLLAPRGPGEAFSRSDRQLLETLARQAGVAAYNVRLTQDLQSSREQLVTTREEERRRLRRDLHDGLGPVLAAMSFKLDAIYNLAGQEAGAVQKMAVELKGQVQEALADIRRIAYDLRPPALDELGLVGALKAHISSYSPEQGLRIQLEAPEGAPTLPAAVEVAAYRIATEAINNVFRHSGAQHCSVRLSLPDDLYLEIVDDGRGLPRTARAGVGMVSMRERAEELGGWCSAEALPQGGTGIRARLPLASSPDFEKGS